MYSPKIKEKYIPKLYRIAKSQSIPMTKLVNEVIEDYLLTVKCSKCLMQLEIDEMSDIVYCPYCECEVFAVTK